MAKTSSWLLVALLLSCFGTPAESACDGALHLELAPSKATYRLAEDVAVRIAVVNRLRPGAGADCVIPPGFVLEHEPNSAAYFVVRVTLVKPDGISVVSPQKPVNAIPIRPPLAQFRPLGPGAFVGRTLWLQSVPLGLPVDEPGRYTLRVSVTSDAQSWVRERIASDKRLARDFFFSADDVFQGALQESGSFVVE